MAPNIEIEAAGGVLWRPAIGGSGIEVALVHRPKYDDWSLPKGKLVPGEHPLLGAVREIQEETGFDAVLGRYLGETRYLKDGAPKRVRYWAMRAEGGGFAPNPEVDQIMWLPPREGCRHLLPDRDRSILEEFAKDPEPSWPCLLVRHGSAGDRGSWAGDDRERPLDETGQRQAAALADLFAAYGVHRLLSADVLRCLDTLSPYATARQLTIESEPLVSETGYASHPDAALERLSAIIGDRVPTVVCSQGGALPELLTRLCRELHHPAPADASVRKGGFWAVHVAANGKLRLVGLERFAPPA